MKGKVGGMEVEDEARIASAMIQASILDMMQRVRGCECACMQCVAAVDVWETVQARQVATSWECKTKMEGMPRDGILPVLSHLRTCILCCSVPPAASSPASPSAI